MRRFSVSTSFIDLLFNILLGVVCLFLIALTIINPNNNKNIPKPTVESVFSITLEWDNTYKSDVDLLAKMPDETIVFFQNRDTPLANLDRDDTGHSSDTIELPDGSKKVIATNMEHIFIKEAAPGWYTVNALLYLAAEKNIPVTITVESFSPYKLIYKDTKVLEDEKDELTYINFRVNKKGKVVEITDTQEKMTN